LLSREGVGRGRGALTTYHSKLSPQKISVLTLGVHLQAAPPGYAYAFIW